MIFYYRGDIDYCNYSCPYCPFADNKIIDEKVLEKEKDNLNKFIEKIKTLKNDISIMFTPMGEISLFDFYKKAFLSLEKIKNVKKIVFQTNLSADYSFLKNSKKISIWASFHPSQISNKDFLNKILELKKYNIPISVGTVGIKEEKNIILDLKNSLPDDIYFWINAYKDEKNYYSKEDIEFFTKIDKLFPLNLNNYESFNKECSTGKDVFLILGNGDIRRCHLNKKILGNLYKDDLMKISKNIKCENNICDCYISYIHLKNFKYRNLYKDKILERICEISINRKFL